MQVNMKSYGVRHDENAVIELDGGRRGTCHWPLAARAWPLAAPAVPAEVLLRLTVRKVEPTLGTTLLIVVIVLLIGAVAGWPYSREWGYGPSGSIGLRHKLSRRFVVCRIPAYPPTCFSRSS
jgi:hypothetical protein